MEIRLVSCLEKIFPDGRGVQSPAPDLCALQGEAVAFQCALCSEQVTYLYPRLEGEIPGTHSIRRVDLAAVQSSRPAESCDEHYLSNAPGLYPDILSEMPKGFVCPPGQWQALFIEIEVSNAVKAGDYPLALVLESPEGEVLGRAEVTLSVIGAQLPPQRMQHTEWFYADCLADYYQVPVFSEKHWEIIGHFMRTAARRGCTTILTPQFTPPLDTYVGCERTTVQLVDVEKDDQGYHFEFSKLKRWMDLALACGLSRFEFSHLFTQWGAKAAPKIMGMKDGRYQRLFGWDTPALGGEYARFLQAYLPVLVETLQQWGMGQCCCFHVSDEPGPDMLPHYLQAKQIVEPLLAGFPIMDALSDLKIAQDCRISPPIACVNHLDTFLEAGISPLWGYYCCSPGQVYTNRFHYMSLARVRIMGMQWWKYNLGGFLHWGYNFYNTVQSFAPINPYLDCEAGGGLPAGDPFLVYPGMDGKPVESLRLIAMHYAMQDARALDLLESLMGRDAALSLLEAEGPFTLSSYPQDGAGLMNIRRRINEAILACLQD